MEDFVKKYDSQLQRFFEFILGFMTWMFLTSPVWLGIFYPKAIVYILTYLTIYWSFMAFKHTIGMILGYRKYQQELKIDWWEKCKELDFSKLPDKKTLPPSLGDVMHFFLIPCCTEPEEALHDTISAIKNQSFPLEQVVMIFAMEGRYAEQEIPVLEKVLADVKCKFKKTLIYTHPAGIEGEAVGAAAANRAWAAKHAVADLVAAGENLRNYIFSTVDADHVIHPQYIARLTHLYLSTDNRDFHYFSTAVHLFNNNLWRVPSMLRIEANAVTMGSLSDWSVSDPSVKDTFAAYSSSLQTLIDADFWDVALGVDDTIFYWRAYFARNGDFTGVPHYIPYSADAVEGKGFFDSHKRLYKQLLRWGWGAIDFPLSMKEFMRNKNIPIEKKLHWSFKHIEKRVILISIVFMITFGFGIVTLVNPYFKQSNFAYSLPKIMSTILSLTMVFFVPATIYRYKLNSPVPRDYPIWKRIIVLLEGPMVIINLLTFSFLPWIEAQTRMMLGKKMKDLYHTPKIR